MIIKAYPSTAKSEVYILSIQLNSATLDEPQVTLLNIVHSVIERSLDFITVYGERYYVRGIFSRLQ